MRIAVLLLIAIVAAGAACGGDDGTFSAGPEISRARAREHIQDEVRSLCASSGEERLQRVSRVVQQAPAMPADGTWEFVIPGVGAVVVFGSGVVRGPEFFAYVSAQCP